MISLRNNERVTLTDKGLRLVTLKMTNEVPFGVFRKLRGLVNKLLHVILSEVAVSSIVNLPNHFHRLGFAHSY